MQQKTIRFLSLALFIGLLIWGIYTLFIYIGVPAHTLVLLDNDAVNSLEGLCGAGNYFCRGLYGFSPFIERTIARAAPFLWYAVVSVILYALFLGWRGLKTGRFECHIRVRPWNLLLLFVGAMWLLITVLSLGMKEDNTSVRRLVEPLPEVYRGASEEGLAVLRENFDRLQRQDCLIYKGQFTNGAGAYELKEICVQKSFFVRVLGPLLFLLFLFLNFLVAGRAVMKWLKMKPERLLVESMVSTGLGACVLIAILWFLAVISMHVSFLQLYTTVVGWVILIAIPLLGIRHMRYWLKQFVSASWDVEESWHSVTLILFWLLLSYLALNFLTVIRPFPIGWDDLGSYLNRPRLLVSYGHFIYSMAPFQWEYITSLGFLLFGYNGTFSATAAMIINWSTGLLATLSVFMLVNVFLGKRRGILAALLYYTLPMVGHFSFADMKVDNAVFTMSALSLFCVFCFLFLQDTKEEGGVQSSPAWSWLIAAGIFGGFAFGMKVTAAMVIMAIGAIMIGALLHWSAFIAAVFFACALFVSQGALDVQGTAERILGEGTNFSIQVFLAILVLIGAAFLAVPLWKKRQRIAFVLRALLIYGGVLFLSILPWLAHNNFLYGNTVPRLVWGAPNNTIAIFDTDGSVDPSSTKNVVRKLPPELQLDRSSPHCVSTSAEEELGRYWGFRKGWKHYVTLPWRTVMNMDSMGYYVTTMPALLLVPFLMLLPFFWIRRRARWIRWLFLGTGFMLLQWMFLANGVPWYGLGTTLGLVVILEVLVAKSPDIPNRVAAGGFITLSLLSVFAMRFWQFEQQRNLLEFPMGKASAAVMVERTVPHYNDIADVVVERNRQLPDRPYLYRIGTFMPYFIPRNLEIIGIADHQLGFFNCLYQERDAEITLKRLRALGFNSIIFDTNTATIEKDPNGSLHQKVNTFIDFINSPNLGLDVVVSDPQAGIAFILIP